MPESDHHFLINPYGMLFEEAVTRGLGGQLAWPALLRKLDRIDSSYRNWPAAHK